MFKLYTIIIILSSLVLSGCSLGLGQMRLSEIEKIDEKILEIEVVQNINKASKGKYLNIPKNNEDGVEYRSLRYTTPKGEEGYFIMFFKEENGKKYTKRIGYGVEAENLTFPWEEDITP